MKLAKHLVNLLLILSVFFSGMGIAAPASSAHGAMSGSMAKMSAMSADCEKSEVVSSCAEHESHEGAVHSLDEHQSVPNHHGAGCCKTCACSCPAGASVLTGLSLHLPSSSAATPVFAFDSNAYISPASKRRIKPPIA